MSVWADVVETIRPGRDAPDGRLPPLLLLLTAVTGLVDAASYLRLGHVFVANMTGNVVFLGFAVAGASGTSLDASLVALGAFLAGGLVGGALGGRLGWRGGTLLRGAVAIQLVAVAAAALLAAVAGGDPIGGARRLALTAILAGAMGVQNAAVRRLAVPELTTTVLTMTLTGIAGDSRLAGGNGSRLGRRGLAVTAMFAGALAGALLALHVETAATLAAAAGVLALVVLATGRLAAA